MYWLFMYASKYIFSWTIIVKPSHNFLIRMTWCIFPTRLLQSPSTDRLWKKKGLIHEHCEKYTQISRHILQRRSSFLHACHYSISRLMSCQKMCLQYQIVNSCNCSDVGLPILPEKEYENIQLCRNDDDFPDSCMFNATQECLNKLKGMHDR